MVKPGDGDEATSASKNTDRIEAFSDGVFAIAITLLVLDLKAPATSDLAGGGLLAALLRQWPAYAALIISFLTILIMWMNHHTLFRHIARTDHAFLTLNGLLLLGVTVVPFPTALLAQYVQERDASVAAALYSGLFTLIGVAFNLVWHYAAHNNRLLAADADPHAVRDITRSYRFGPLLYFVAFLLAFVSVPASVTLCMLLSISFALPLSVTHRGAGTP